MDRSRSPGWAPHPGVRGKHELTLGERAAELARRDYQKDSKAEALIERLSTSFAVMAARHEELHRQIAELKAALELRQ